MKRFIVLSTLVAIALATLNGCIAINSNGYYLLTAEQRTHVVRPSRPLDELVLCDSVYVVDDRDVREWLADKELALVCHFFTWCKGEFCMSPAAEHELLTRTGLPFLMIAGDFESLRGYNAPYPYITIDQDYYGTRRYDRLMKRMFQALGLGKNWWHSYVLFRRGEYLGSGRTLEEAMAPVAKPGTARVAIQ